MVTGRRERYRETLTILGRALGLSGLALATLASGPCGPCTVHDDCATVDDLLATREAGIAKASASSSSSAGSAGATAVALAMNIAKANEWSGQECPTPDQYRAIVELEFPGRYSDGGLTVTDLVDGKCCYHFEGEDCGQGGRPFLVHGQPRVASLIGAYAEHEPWLADARVEHASVAAFARLSLLLMALGAPSDLVRDAQLASLDELRHADIFFRLASRASGTSLGPGSLDVRGALDDVSLAGLIESNLREGCIGETLAAEQLRERADRISDPELRATLLTIADDETRHAELAFRILGWCRDTAPELTRATVARVLDESSRERLEDETWRHVLSPLLGAVTA